MGTTGITELLTVTLRHSEGPTGEWDCLDVVAAGLSEAFMPQQPGFQCPRGCDCRKGDRLCSVGYLEEVVRDIGARDLFDPDQTLKFEKTITLRGRLRDSFIQSDQGDVYDTEWECEAIVETR